MNEDLKIIKKKYGEKMMHLCRELFPTILEEPGLLPKLLLANFYPSVYLCDDIVANGLEADFKNAMFAFKDYEEFPEILGVSAYDLMRSVGYTLYECKTEEEIQFFKKYYAFGEALCTFKGGRLEKRSVFFAVKDGAEDLKRSDFKNPQRQDEYGTSVISIQFAKNASMHLTITNRYNHTVLNCDATFSNNLENIVPGLTKAFENDYGLIQNYKSTNFDLPNYERASDGRFYKYNYEEDDIYYCTDNIIIDNGEVKKFPKEQYIIIEGFVLDLKNKTIKQYNPKATHDSFLDFFEKIERIEIKKTSEGRIVYITVEGDKTVEISIDHQNRIIGYSNSFVRIIDDSFLHKNVVLKKLDLANVERIGNDCLPINKDLEEVNLPKLWRVGNNFLARNKGLTSISLPLLLQVGDNFLTWGVNLKSLSCPKVKIVGNDFLTNNVILEDLDMVSLQVVGYGFLWSNNALRTINFPKLKIAGGCFMENNNCLVEVIFPELEEVAYRFMASNDSIVIFKAPKLEKIGIDFFTSNRKMEIVDVSNLKIVDDNFFYKNNTLKELYCPYLKSVGRCFMGNNSVLEVIYAPLLEEVGQFSFAYNENIYQEILSQLNGSGRK